MSMVDVMAEVSELEVLRQDNSRMQLKIRAQEGAYQKLLKEKEEVLKAYQEAKEKIRYKAKLTRFYYINPFLAKFFCCTF